MGQGLTELEDLSLRFKNNQRYTEPSSSRPPLQQTSLRSVCEDVLQLVRKVQMDSNASSWKDTLEDWKGFLEILSEKKQFLDCSGTEDCISYFFDQLWDLYEFEDDVEALKIKKLLPDLQHEMNELIRGERQTI